jgi:3-dehydroquinate dehydratase-2
MSTAHNRIGVMHGVNFDVLERRDPEIYGGHSLTELEVRIKHWSRERGLEARFFQSNSEGEFVEHLHRLPELADGVIINAGAWTHYSRAIADALQLSALPAVEVHLSDVEAREDWRKLSVFDGMVVAKISGKGVEGYREAIDVLANELGAARPGA